MGKKKKKFGDLSELGGMVFSTNDNYEKEHYSEEEEEQIDPKKGKLILRYETAHRGGKKVTIVERFQGNEDQLKSLGKELKQHCGTGGSVVDGEILVQGDQREKLKTYLRKQGYKTNDI